MRRCRTLIAAVGLAAVISAAGMPAAAAVHAPTTHHTGARTVAGKPMPSRPADAVDRASGPRIVPKPRSRAALATTVPGRVTLIASPAYLWPGQYTTLTATTDQDVSSSSYAINIYNTGSNTLVASCGTGTTCGAALTEMSATTDTFVAVVSSFSATYPPANVQVSSASTPVGWLSVSVELSASPTSVIVGGKTTLTALASADIGTTPFYTEIFDDTTSTLLAACGYDYTCTAQTTQAAATTDSFTAYVTFYSATTPASYQAASAASFVTWSTSGYSVYLSALRTGFTSGTADASTNLNVTTNDIVIYDETTNTVLTNCTAVTDCSADFSPTGAGDRVVAFVTSGPETGLPPAGDILASSNVSFTG